MTRWLFLRGLTRSAAHWDDFPERFGDRLGGVRVDCIELPGNGSLNRTRSPSRIEAIAEHCRQEALARRIPPPYRLLALSLGAMVALAWSIRHPHEVEAGVLINTSLRPYAPFHRRLRPTAWLPLIALCRPGLAPHEREAAILRLSSRLAADPERILARWCALRREFPVGLGNALRQLLAATRFRAPATPPAAPLLLLAGSGDRLVDPACSRQLAGRWRCAYAEHPQAGHDLPLDAADWVVEQVRDWLERDKAAP